MPALLVWGFWLASSPVARGAATALAAWTKFAALIVVPLWLTYPSGIRLRHGSCGSPPASPLATLARLLDPPARALARRRAPHVLGPDARLPARPGLAVLDLGLGPVPRARDPRSRVAADRRPGVRDRRSPGVAAALPREKGPLELAALTAALLLAFELSLTHWSYLYLPWVLPFVLLALFLPRSGPPAEPEAPETTEAAPPEMAGVS